jgi:hypothetical protein
VANPTPDPAPATDEEINRWQEQGDFTWDACGQALVSRIESDRRVIAEQAEEIKHLRQTLRAIAMSSPGVDVRGIAFRAALNEPKE